MIEIQPLDQVVRLSLQHGKVNAMDLEFCQLLTAQLTELADDAGCRGAILAGNERAFSAGIDLKRLVMESPDYVDEFFPALTGLFYQAIVFPKPLIVAISGHALAGGCVLASTGDYRLIRPDAKIGMPELRVGLSLPAEGIETFRFVLGANYFQRVVTSGKSFQNQEAVLAGLADEFCPSDRLLEQAEKYAQQYARIPADVFAITKSQIRQPLLERIEKNRSSYSERVQAMWKSPEIRESVARYITTRL
jgi:enoyl-CoA hydratase